MFGEYKSYYKDFRIHCGAIYHKSFAAVNEQFIFIVVPYSDSNALKINLAIFYAKCSNDGKLLDKIRYIDNTDVFDLNANPTVTVDDVSNAVKLQADSIKRKVQNFYENRKDVWDIPKNNPNLFNEEWTFTPLSQMYLNQKEFKDFYDTLAAGLNLPTLKEFIEFCRTNLKFGIDEEEQ